MLRNLIAELHIDTTNRPSSGPGSNNKQLLYGKNVFWRMPQSDWLLTGQDFPVLPTGNAQFLRNTQMAIGRKSKI
jgi:hypothetical protein